MKIFTYQVLLIAIFSVLSFENLYAQDYKSQINISADNDQYLNPSHDRYYTEGALLSFTHALKKPAASSKLFKKTLELELGQRIYNSYTASARRLQPDPFVFLPYAVDRPFTAYLYAGASMSWLYNNENALKVTAELGTIGPAALGEQVQVGFHNLFKLYKVRGWPYQLKNAAGVNLKIDYKMFLYRNDANWFDMAFNPTGWLGTTFTGASAGMQFRFGVLNKFYQSNITDSRVSNDPTEYQGHEFYFFTIPQVNYAAYDATIEGGLGLQDKGPVTFGIYHYVYQQQFGLTYASSRWSASYIAFIRSREVKSTALGDQWASVNLTYRFGKI